MHVGGMSKGKFLDARGKFGWSGGLGRLMLGYNRLGFYNWDCGIYQKKYLWGKPYLSKEKFYRPKNPQTDEQQAWRAVYATGILTWQSMSLEDKNIFNKCAYGKKMSGYNLFLKEYLLSH